MILHPGVLALVASSLLVAGMVGFAGWQGLRVLRAWDPSSGSARQLDLERRTTLVSALLAVALGVELPSLFLYVYTADAVAPLLTGATCAGGTLRATPLGMPVLVLKLVNVLLAGVWLAVNHADGLGPDAPLVRRKYALLLPLAPLLALEAAGQIGHFAALRPEVVTTCCGRMLGGGGEAAAVGVAGLSPGPASVAFFAAIAAVLAAGAVFQATGRGGVFFAAAAALALPVALFGIVSFVSPYLYGTPTHHCPFCLLQREHGYVGYPLYATLLGGAVTGMGVGALAPARRVASLAEAVPALQRRLASASMVLYALFTMIVTWRIDASALRS
ncbi:MAG TPA: hypothetical protein VLS93_02510 [Anaeromyxobacteraceae bacterium]|nr:hypothetical protein [Anaeromyxobacteraceae bacterium]